MTEQGAVFVSDARMGFQLSSCDLLNLHLALRRDAVFLPQEDRWLLQVQYPRDLGLRAEMLD